MWMGLRLVSHWIELKFEFFGRLRQLVDLIEGSLSMNCKLLLISQVHSWDAAMAWSEKWIQFFEMNTLPAQFCIQNDSKVHRIYENQFIQCWQELNRIGRDFHQTYINQIDELNQEIGSEGRRRTRFRIEFRMEFTTGNPAWERTQDSPKEAGQILDV
jgi:hypothetical protein